MDGLKVTVDLLHHNSELCVRLGLVPLLGGVPNGVVAVDAVDLVYHACLVRDFGDILVALDATPRSMDAFSELVWDHIQLADSSICTWGRKTWISMAAQAAIICEVAKLRSCGMGWLLSQYERCSHANGGCHQPRCQS